MEIQDIKNIPLFSEFSETHCSRLLEISKTMSFRAGEIIFHEKSMADNSFYCILEGTIQIFKEVAGTSQTKTLAYLRQYDALGEMTIYDAICSRSAGALAATETTLLAVDRAKFLDLMESHPDLGYRFLKKMVQTLISRLRNTDKNLMDVVAWSVNERR